MDVSTDSFSLRPRAAVSQTRSEGILLALAGVFLFANYLALALQLSNVQLTHWIPFVVWVLCAVTGNRILNRYLPGRDPLFFSLAMFLSGWGLVIIDRLLPNFADRQILWLALSVAAMISVAVLPHTLRWLRNYRYILLLGGLALLVSTMIFGQNPSGLAGAPQLWLGFGGVYFQPSEALKIILVAFLASYLGEQYPTLRSKRKRLGTDSLRFSLSPRIIGPILLMWGISIVILIWQRDLGTAVLFFLVFLALLYIASGYTLIVVSGAVLITIAGLVAYNLFYVVQLRVDIWLNPWPEASDRAYQIVQSLQAFASGSVFGQGIGQGAPTYIPVVHSDFVFAALAEEWGLLGVIVLIACFAIFFMRGLHIAMRQHGHPFYTLLAIGLSALIAIQSLLIMGGVLKLIPLTGVTLPYLSYGGSSLLMSFIIIGLLLRLSARGN